MREYSVLDSTIDAAIRHGYRSIDTASVYRNEHHIGRILKDRLLQHNLQRKDIFITSKLGPSQQGKDKALVALKSSLQCLELDYLDLYLVHWPGTQGLKPENPDNKQYRKETWLALEEGYKQGLVKSIGVSNYTQHHLEELLTYCTVKPMVLQIEYHPHLVQSSLKKFCEDHSIHFQAYSSLGTSDKENKVITDPVIVGLAAKLGKTPAQVLLRWAVQQDVGVIPKSANQEHIASNIDIFDFSLSPEDMIAISQLDKQTHYCWDPSKVS